MNTTVLLLSAAYVTVAGMLLVILLSTTVPLIVRGTATVLVLVLMYLTYANIGDLRGWPSDDPPPERFKLLWGRVMEPDPLTKDKGRIFLWIEELDEDNYPVGYPRGHALPYSRDLADLVDVAVAAVGAGENVSGSMTQVAPDEETAERMTREIEMAAEGRPSADNIGERYLPTDFGDLRFYNTPKPVTPEKK